MKLNLIRLSQNLKQEYIAHEIKVSQKTISAWEKGTRQPPIKILPKLAKILNCSIEDLVYAIINTSKGV